MSFWRRINRATVLSVKGEYGIKVCMFIIYNILFVCSVCVVRGVVCVCM